MRLEILRVNGTRDRYEVEDADVFHEIERLIGARFLDRVSLGFPRWLLFDQQGRGLVNPYAERIAGRRIHGDAAVIDEADYRP